MKIALPPAAVLSHMAYLLIVHQMLPKKLSDCGHFEDVVPSWCQA
jgi:hypothetical protein